MVEKFLLPKKARQKVSPRLAGLEVSAHPTPGHLRFKQLSPESITSWSQVTVQTPCSYSKGQVKTIFQDTPGFFTSLAMTALHKKAMTFGIYL